jgi:hypothetical protein
VGIGVIVVAAVVIDHFRGKSGAGRAVDDDDELKNSGFCAWKNPGAVIDETMTTFFRA